MIRAEDVEYQTAFSHFQYNEHDAHDYCSEIEEEFPDLAKQQQDESLSDEYREAINEMIDNMASKRIIAKWRNSTDEERHVFFEFELSSKINQWDILRGAEQLIEDEMSLAQKQLKEQHPTMSAWDQAIQLMKRFDYEKNIHDYSPLDVVALGIAVHTCVGGTVKKDDDDENLNDRPEEAENEEES